MCAHRTILGALVALVLLSSPLMVSPAQAQTRAGVQTGASLDPDQFFFGGHLRTAPLVDRVRFRPSADIGVGDNLTLIALNLDFTYGFTSRQPWSLYVGAGPAVNFYRFSGNTETQGGFNFIIGGQHRDGLFGEMKIGAMDSPNLKFMIGYTFH